MTPKEDKYRHEMGRGKQGHVHSPLFTKATEHFRKDTAAAPLEYALGGKGRQSVTIENSIFLLRILHC